MASKRRNMFYENKKLIGHTITKGWQIAPTIFRRLLHLVLLEHVSVLGRHFLCLVLATGSTDIPNRLNIPGEEDSRWVHHDLRHLEDALEEIGRRSHPSQDRGDVLVVGAGLSAADAVLGARFHGLRVIHVFRRPTVSTERTLPESVYPEYHKIGAYRGYTIGDVCDKTLRGGYLGVVWVGDKSPGCRNVARSGSYKDPSYLID
ncbi:hypothetical protein AAG570_007388 [Ranatra chinensis]|uniref:Uncharacterized protein n=1 Tax=Ranatra chinensis TaxID=642074 RepID=A0ABD0XW11_9HEMI